MAEQDGRNFRSFYYETLGLRNVDQKKALEFLLKDDPIDVERVATFSIKFSLPAVLRTHVWKVLLGVLPPYQEAHTYVSQQREGQFEDLKHALTIMRRLSETDDLAQQICNMFLLEEGGMRFVRVPKKLQKQVEQLQMIVSVFSDMFEDEMDLYWLSVKFLKCQEHIEKHVEQLKKLVQHYLQMEDVQLWKHLLASDGFNHLPYRRWFVSSFIEDLPDSCLERIWDKVVAGSCKILVFVAVALLVVFRHALLNAKTATDITKFLNQPFLEDSFIIIVSKAMELWDKHGGTIISEAPTVH